MAKVGIIFFSGSGTTAKFAQAVEAGAQAADAECFTHRIEGGEIDGGRWANEAVVAELDACDAIIFGTPTYMGGVSAQLKAFFDGVVPHWYTQSWNGKLAAAFTASAKISGDKFNCLVDIMTFAMQMGMVWVGTGSGPSLELNPHGYYIGVGASAMNEDDCKPEDLAAATDLGRRVATLAAG